MSIDLKTQKTLVIQEANPCLNTIPSPRRKVDDCSPNTVVGAPDTKSTILVVDDDYGIRTLFKEALTSEGHEVLTAPDPNGAREWLEHTRVDLVISDVKMPGEDGVSLLKEVQKTHPGLPVIMISGDSSEKSVFQCIRNGAIDFVAKPLSLEKLRTVVAETVHAQRRAHVSLKALTTKAMAQQQIGNYRVIRPLGQGSQGTVLLAERPDDDVKKLYAMKIFNSYMRPLERARFDLEARISKMINHKNVVRLHDSGVVTETGAPYLVYEYVAGHSLRFVIRKSVPLPFRQRVKLLADIANALSAIHEMDVIHRDVKPENILLEHNLCAKLTDFGIAKMPQVELTMTNTTLGSPSYMSPESLKGEPLEPTADIFSLGLVAYELLVGKHPFTGAERNIPAMTHAILCEKPIAPAALSPGFPLPLQDLLARMLRKNPVDRISTAQIVADRLQHFIDTPSYLTAKPLADADWRIGSDTAPTAQERKGT